MSDYSTLIKRLRGEHGTEPWQINPAAKIAADAIEALESDFHKQADMNGRLLTANAELRQTLDDVWQDLYIVLGHIRTAIREKSK